MDSILAAKVLMSHLPEITDGAYKIATEIAIETLFSDALSDWHVMIEDGVSAMEYLGLTEDEFYYWLLGGKKVAEKIPVCHGDTGATTREEAMKKLGL